MNYFETKLNEHLKNVDHEIDKMQNNLKERSLRHDRDKLEDPLIYKLYTKHRKEQLKYKWGSEKRLKVEAKMKPATDKHVKNERHHFYSKNSDYHDQFTAFDILEHIADLKATIYESGITENKDILKQYKVFLKTLKIDNTIKDLLLRTMQEQINMT